MDKKKQQPDKELKKKLEELKLQFKKSFSEQIGQILKQPIQPTTKK